MNKVNLKTINGVNKTDGMIKIKAKILDIENIIDVFVVNNENFNYDFLIGLDCIKIFKLSQNERLEITQTILPQLENINTKINSVINDKDISDTPKNSKFTINFNENINTENFEIIINHLNNYEKSEINKLVKKYNNIFAKDKYDIGTVKEYEAKIELTLEKYCSKRPYRCTIQDQKEIESQITSLLKNNLIEESYSPFAAPVTLAYKKDENRKSRLCIDFRDLNKIIIPQAQPFPLIEDLITKTRNCRYFSSLDINSAFWSIPLRIEDRYKTAFVTQEGHFQWTCLPFGLKTSPAIFQRILSNIIRKHNLSDFATNYIDDILIFSRSFEEHISHLSKLLDAISIEGFRLKFSKCKFASDSVKYLGHVISYNSVSPLKDNLTSIKNFPTPKTQKNIRQFLGKINFYNKYVPKISIILDPLHNLLRKNQKFIWTDDCEKTFKYLKNFLCTQPVLAIYDPNLPIYIYTDASLQGVGAVLKQPQTKEGKFENSEKPVAYFSRKLNEAQKKKKAIYLECLAIQEAVKYWQHWLLGRSFTVFCDHKPLERMNIKTRTDEELGDLTHYLSQYDFEIKYYPGKNNTEADCLSRNPVLDPSNENDDILKVVNFIQLNDIIEDQRKNEEIISKVKKSNNNTIILKNNVYYKKTKNEYNKIILSEDLSKNIIKNIHVKFCHIGTKQIQEKLNPFYTAKNLTKNIIKICNTCDICIKNKSRAHTKYGFMSLLGPAKKPFEIISIDTIGGFGGLRSTKKYLHLLVDHFTRYAYILTSKTQTAQDFIKLTQNIPDNNTIGMILTDQYPGLNSKEFKEFLNEKHIPLVFTAKNAPFSNGLNERLNQTLINKIRCKINEKTKKFSWTNAAHECVKQYNKTVHTVTKFTPRYLLSGIDDSILPKELKQEKNTRDLHEDRKRALLNSIKYHNYNKKLFDKNRKNHEFRVGDLVYVENGNRLNRKKMDELKIGPFEIVDKVSNSIYKINVGHKKLESNLFHITKLVPILDEGRGGGDVRKPLFP